MYNLFLSHDPEIILTCWFIAQETFISIITGENIHFFDFIIFCILA